MPQEITGQPRRVVVGGVHWRHTFASLRYRNFRLFFFGQLLSLIGTWVQTTAQAWLIYQLTNSKLWLGTLAAVGSAPMLLFSVWGGSLADRHAKRTVLLWTQAAMMLFALALAVLTSSGAVRPWHIMGLAALGGIAMAFDMPARQAFMVEITSREDLINAISLNSSIVNGARVAGPALAGFLMTKTNVASCFFLNATSFIAVLTGLALMRLPKFVSVQSSASTWHHALEGFRYVAKHQPVRRLLLLFGIVGVFGWSYSVLMPALAKEVFGVGESGYSALLSANGLGALLGALTVAIFGTRIRHRTLVFGGLGVFSVMLVLLGVIPGYRFALAIFAIAGWGMMLYFSTTNTLVQTSVPDEMRGRVMGIWALVFGGMLPLGALQAGALSQWLGVRWTIAAGGLVCALAGFMMWRGLPRDPSPNGQSAGTTIQTGDSR